MGKLLDFGEPSVKRNKAFNARLREITVKKLKAICEKHGISQSDLIEHLIGKAFEESGLRLEAPKKAKKS